MEPRGFNSSICNPGQQLHLFWYRIVYLYITVIYFHSLPPTERFPVPYRIKKNRLKFGSAKNISRLKLLTGLFLTDKVYPPGNNFH